MEPDLADNWKINPERTLEAALTDIVNACGLLMGKVARTDDPEESERWMALASGALTALAVAADGFTADQVAVTDSVERGLAIAMRLSMDAAIDDLVREFGL